MDSSGFSSPRTDCFPAGLRVLVVDDDPTWLKILEKMLKKCNYEVTTCNLARDALNLLRERKDGFDIVISDVNMPDMDGFKLLEHVGLEMDLPVIMMSVDGETSRVMKGVQHGACDYLLKPIRMKELRNIWQHVFRKRIHEVRDIEGHESLEEIQMMRSGGGAELLDDNFLFGGDLSSGKKRKDVDNKYDDRVCGDPSSVKKARVVWTVDLHQKFVKAVNQIGFEKVGPKKILDLMGVPWLTRENVASHLQKYRLYLSRLQKENELKATFAGVKHSDLSSKEPSGNICLQNPSTQTSTNVQQTIIPKESYTHKNLIQKDEPKICNNKNTKGILPVPLKEPKNPLFGETNPDLASCSTSRISFNHPFGPTDADTKSEPKIPVQYTWSAKAPPPQFKQEHKPHFQTEPIYDHHLPPLPMHHNIQADVGPTSKEFDKPPHEVEKATKVENTAALFSIQPESHLIPCENLFDDVGSPHRILTVGSGSVSALRLWGDQEFNSYSSQGDFYAQNAFFGNVDAFGHLNQELIADVPPYLFDPSDTVEYPVINQGLFIA